jgi:predicted 3-demethylubiquinone-9 3-methyltransferase (glyoxalase superfamily)
MFLHIGISGNGDNNGMDALTTNRAPRNRLISAAPPERPRVTAGRPTWQDNVDRVPARSSIQRGREFAATDPRPDLCLAWPDRAPPWNQETPMIAKNTICLWYDGTALDAAKFYTETFPDSAVGAVHHAPGDFPSGKQGDVLTVEFTVMGIPCVGLNGGSEFKHSEAFSFQVATDDQEETDRLWNAIVGNGGQESVCGWCKDKWGVSWQISPRVLIEAVAGPDPAAAKRAFDAMMKMTRIDIATIEAALRGTGKA